MQIKLITLYSYICECYDTTLQWYCQRNSKNNVAPIFTDQELLTVYLFAIMQEGYSNVKQIHQYIERYWASWFPKLPSYPTFVNRLNYLTSCLPTLIALLLKKLNDHEMIADVSLIDSFPIFTCSAKRNAKVATELTDKGFCATKEKHYYGLKMHVIAFRKPQQLPIPEFIQLTPASHHDLPTMRTTLASIENRKFFADKAYADQALNELLSEKKSTLFTPVKLIKGQDASCRQFDQAYNNLFSKAVSTIRQPIESFFNWLQQKTNIQNASKVRSSAGLIVHCFGRFAAAIALWIF